ncbi:putative outer membrane protein [Emticicia oligotrophica DSM 17448]|uniref:Outer membrane protein n=1 Tax=Emticicia oligotrophica (strain DSM 17448 / CIP 109782 / MTCC 6937 / GPTSA100-15) TaxID=929562 RepID=A0ABM5N1H7_EMTOG|nr:TolC family protein [Emticicia oligotrophica]AFK03245.1 putative outer membrane protein [Emticicia oligotrophica DSM 17448]
MKLTRKNIYILGLSWLLSLFSLKVFSQKTEVFSFQDFQEIVLKNHPVIKQANLYLDDAKAELIQARGQFDPKLSTNFDRKSLDGKDYYNRLESTLKVPIYSGIELKGGYEQNSGTRLRSDESASLIFTGISVPLGQGLLIDARRNTLLQAKLLGNMAQAERQKTLNKFIFSAAKDYWEWYLSYQKLKLNQEAFQMADERFKLLSERTRIGEAAAIDSIEARITVQDRSIALEQSMLEFQNASLALSNYLWNSSEQPLELSSNFIPQETQGVAIERQKVDDILKNLEQNHPEIAKIILKQKQLRIEEGFRKEMLKPQFNVSFNFLQVPLAYQKESVPSGFLVNNHKIGVNFEMPLFLRKERGKLQSVRIKQLQTSFDKTIIERELRIAVESAYNEVQNLAKQIEQQLVANSNQAKLLEAEKQKFLLGESTLFLINSRETKLIEMKTKLETLKSKYEKAIATLQYSGAVQL